MSKIAWEKGKWKLNDGQWSKGNIKLFLRVYINGILLAQTNETDALAVGSLHALAVGSLQKKRAAVTDYNIAGLYENEVLGDPDSDAG